MFSQEKRTSRESVSSIFGKEYIPIEQNQIHNYLYDLLFSYYVEELA